MKSQQNICDAHNSIDSIGSIYCIDSVDSKESEDFTDAIDFIDSIDAILVPHKRSITFDGVHTILCARGTHQESIVLSKDAFHHGAVKKIIFGIWMMDSV